jgi:putative Ca2+/H+ antiporter (TMEM165/GDT1 family)
MLGSWSIMYRESVWYRLSEYTLIGLFMGYGVVSNISVVRYRIFDRLVETPGDVTLYIVLAFGIMYILRVIPQIRWIARFPISLLAGAATGSVMAEIVQTQIIKLVSTGSFTATGTKYGTPISINNIIIFIVTLCAMTYFIFTHRHTGVLGVTARIGRYGLMIAFGMVMGTYLITNISFAIGQMSEFILTEKIIAVPVGIVVLIIGIVGDQLNLWERMPHPFGRGESS